MRIYRQKAPFRSSSPDSSCRLALVALLAVATALLGACTTTTVSAIHDPLYRAIPHSSSIEAKARNTDVGIARIDIVATTGEMTDCTEWGGPPQIIPCRRNASTITHTCNYTGNPANATCTFTQSLGNQSIVTYHAVATPSSGGSQSTIEVTYAGGYPPAAGIARPIRWQRGEPLASKIDLGFFPDADYAGRYTDFTDDVETIVLDSFYNSGDRISSTYTVFLNAFNLWAAPFGADGSGFNAGSCPRTFDTMTTLVAAEMDGEAIVHEQNFRDCASITLGGSGTVFANATDPNYLLVHESAHFLFAQGDEYMGGGNFSPGPCRNVFVSQAACQAAAPGAGAPATNCVQIGTTGAWRNDDGNLETMDDRDDDSNFLNNSGQCVIERILNCGSGSCY